MIVHDPRGFLSHLIMERREDLAGLSRLLGRNPAYVQQFIKRGTPKQLAERDRKTLARYFNVDEQLLGGPPSPVSSDRLIPIPHLAMGASAGSGAHMKDGERAVPQLGFSEEWLRQLTSAKQDDLSIVKVVGDSMFPTLGDGDDVLVERSSPDQSLLDGIYVLRRDDTLMVKRITVSPSGTSLTVASDNKSYATWTNCSRGEIDLVGRVVWAGRRVR